MRMELFGSLLWLLLRALRTIVPAVVVFLLVRWFMRRSKNLPPGPWGFPLLGCFPAVVWGIMRGVQPHQLFARYGQRYGPVFQVGFLHKTVVFLDDFVSTKAAFQHPQLNDRLEGTGLGVSGSSGEPWIQMRRFCLSVLRSFGVGKSSFEEKIAIEGVELVRVMSAFNGKAFKPNSPLSSAVSNVICSVVFGKRYDYDDEDFRRLLDLMSTLIKSVGPGGAIYTLPFLGSLPYFKSKIKKIGTNYNHIIQFIKTIVDSHRAKLDPHNLNDFIDVYLMELIKRDASPSADAYLVEVQRNATSEVENGAAAKPEKYGHLNENNILYTVNDIFSAGSETTVTTMEWCLLYMAIHPEIQQRVQAEIDAVVGRNRLPRLADKPELNLTLAVIWEVQRMANIVPLGLPHAAASDMHFQGFFIPKGAVLVSNMWSIFRDPKLWPEPERFNPYRFINDEGRAVAPEEFIPFGIGRRICLGEHLAKMELFVFFSYFMHQFTFVKPADAPALTLEGRNSVTFSPLPFEICAVIRN